MTDFLQFGKKLSAVANVVQVSEQIEKPKKIYENKAYGILLAMKLL